MVRIKESMNFMSSTTSKSGSKYFESGFKFVKSVTEGGEHDEEVVGSNPDPVAADPAAADDADVSCLFTLFVGERVTSSRSVGKAPSHQAGLTPDCC